MSNILVTGCAGFVGSSLTKRLLDLGHEVVGLDRFSDYYDPAIKRRNIAPFADNRHFRLVDGDLCLVSLTELGGDFDQVFHLTPEGWRKLTWRWVWFFFALAVLNEIVWRNVSTDTWVSFKLFGVVPLTFLFGALQYPLIMKYHPDNSSS